MFLMCCSSWTIMGYLTNYSFNTLVKLPTTWFFSLASFAISYATIGWISYDRNVYYIVMNY
uniref:Uncharacterized protein n=1 Tax=Rhizophora mucronata TaxID=61149 RepID=A0A2P2NCQ7_RHIMU